MEERWVGRLLVVVAIVTSMVWGSYARTFDTSLLYWAVAGTIIVAVLLYEWRFWRVARSDMHAGGIMCQILCRCGNRVLVWGEPGSLPALRVAVCDRDHIVDRSAAEIGLSRMQLVDAKVISLPDDGLDVVSFNVAPEYIPIVQRGRYKFVNDEVATLGAQARKIVSVTQLHRLREIAEVRPGAFVS